MFFEGHFCNSFQQLKPRDIDVYVFKIICENYNYIVVQYYCPKYIVSLHIKKYININVFVCKKLV